VCFVGYKCGGQINTSLFTEDKSEPFIPLFDFEGQINFGMDAAYNDINLCALFKRRYNILCPVEMAAARALYSI